MAKPFDAATKRLVEADPLAWLRFLGLPGEQAELMDADLTTVVAEADRILRVRNPDYLAHIELQSTYKVDMGVRTFFYNAVAFFKYRVPIESAILLLRQEADGPAMSGRLAYGSLDFRYRVVRLWEIPPEQLLSASLALLPLAPLTNVTAADLPGLVGRMEARIDREAPVEERGLLWTTTFLLLGLKYDQEFARHLLQGVMAMKESSTYQFILEEGAEKGRIEGERHALLMLGGKRFGEPDVATQTALANITSVETLENLLSRLLEVESWQELFR